LGGRRILFYVILGRFYIGWAVYPLLVAILFLLFPGIQVRGIVLEAVRGFTINYVIILPRYPTTSTIFLVSAITFY
jgi:hypothetical protein